VKLWHPCPKNDRKIIVRRFVNKTPDLAKAQIRAAKKFYMSGPECHYGIDKTRREKKEK
jgi:hypothetical protein